MRNDEGLSLILFTLQGHWLALDITCLHEVLEPLAVSPLPFVPDFVEGLVNANGRIIPQIDLATFSLQAQSGGMADTAKTLLVVAYKSSPVALKVGQVLEPLNIASEQLQDLDEADNPLLKEDYFTGKCTHNGRTVFILDIACLQGVVRSSEPEQGTAGFLGEGMKKRQQEEQLSEYLLLAVADEEYACELHEAYEVVDLPVIKPCPGAPAIVAGIGLVRGLPTLILDLAVLLGLKNSHTAGGGNALCTVIIRGEGYYYGLLVDSVVGLTMVTQSQLSKGRDGHLTILDQNRDMLTRVLALQTLVGEELLHTIRPFMPSVSLTEREVHIKTREVLRFSINDDMYGLFLHDVRRILAQKKIEPLLDKHHFLMGTIEVEGHVVPVINLAAQLNYQTTLVREFIIVNDGKNDWALAVPHTDQILHLPETTIELLQQSDNSYVKALTSHEEQLISILNVDSICVENVRKAG